LAIRIHAAAGVLDDVARGAEPSVGGDRQHRHAAAAVVRDEQVLTTLVENQMARASAHRRTLIDECERTLRRIDRECADGTGWLALELADLVYGEQQPAPQIDLEKRRIRRRGCQSERNERDVLRDLEVRGLQPEQIQPLPLRSCISADI